MMEVTTMRLTDKLDFLMYEKHINKADLARNSGIPYTTIDGFYKKGTENTKLSTLKKLCAYFNCTLDYLADDNVDNSLFSTNVHHNEDEHFTPEELHKIEEYKKLLLAARPKN